MKICPACAREYADAEQRCRQDGAALVRLETSSNERASDLIGQVLDGRYRLDRIVGRGGMGTVYAARHVVVGKEMAVKVLRSSIERSEEILQRFIREAQAANAVRSRHICEMTDFGQLPTGAFYVVMELLDGLSLTRALRENRLSRVQIKRVFIQIAETLDKAHRANIVHRDLKPDNVVLVEDDGDPFFVKLVDFGIAKMMESKASNLTETGVILGTPYYMSPEQARGDSVDYRSDIYALGVMMYRAFTGKLPFVADTAMGVLTRHLTQKPELPSRVVSEIDPSVEGIILRCLEKRPEDRFQSMAHVAQVLRTIADHPPKRDDHATLDERNQLHWTGTTNVAPDRLATPSHVREVDDRASAHASGSHYSGSDRSAAEVSQPSLSSASLAFPPVMPLPAAPLSQSGPLTDPRQAAALGYPAPEWAVQPTPQPLALPSGAYGSGTPSAVAVALAAASPGSGLAGATAAGPARDAAIPGARLPGMGMPGAGMAGGAGAALDPGAAAYQPEAYTNRGVVSSRLEIPQPQPTPNTGIWVGIGGALLVGMLVAGVVFAIGGDNGSPARQTASPPGPVNTAEPPARALTDDDVPSPEDDGAIADADTSPDASATPASSATSPRGQAPAAPPSASGVVPLAGPSNSAIRAPQPAQPPPPISTAPPVPSPAPQPFQDIRSPFD